MVVDVQRVCAIQSNITLGSKHGIGRGFGGKEHMCTWVTLMCLVDGKPRDRGLCIAVYMLHLLILRFFFCYVLSSPVLHKQELISSEQWQRAKTHR